ncbi:MAG: murein biosynthesis integral membrane protein MurJ [Chloroflexi bacterium]|nr:murein biosynthesis integral membrane protein MurJ [Chloroflexota bacterium]
MTLDRRALEAPAPAAPRPAPSQGMLIAHSATIITLGNITSRLLGVVRETVIAYLFGATGLVSAFRLAALVPTTVYDLLMGGMISASLVPVFSEYSTPEGRRELGRVAGAVFSFAALGLVFTVFFLEFAAPFLAQLLGGGFGRELLGVTTDLTRLILPAILFFGVSGISTGLLYASQKFIYPAFGAAVFNLGVILGILFLAPSLGIHALALGVVLGAILQLAIQLPGLRGIGVSLNFVFNPALRRILVLYLPVLLGLVVSNVGILIDRNLASRTGEQSIAWMANATTLIQLPLGLVVVAISTAVLPSLSQFTVSGEEERFRRTLATGLRMVLFLILPATAGLWVLGVPLIDLIFEHGAFTPLDTQMTASALTLYLLGLPFAAIDQPLIFAFYARGDTKTPVLVGIFAVGVYLTVALGTIVPIGFLGLVLANSLQWASHAAAMLFLTEWRVKALRGQQLFMSTAKILTAAVVLAGVSYFVGQWLLGLGWDGFLPEALLVAIAGGAGLGAYFLVVVVLRSMEANLFWQLLMSLIKRSPFEALLKERV